MGLARYFVLRHADHWLVTLEGRAMAHVASKSQAISSAIVMADLMGSKTSTTGELTVRSSNITDTLVDLKDQQDALTARMKVIEQRYYKQFNALDTLLAQMNTTATSLDNWLSQQNKND